MSSAILEMHAITKRFGAVEALAGVDFSACRGEVHALIGENGAGKSTLMKVLSGALMPDSGTITYEGKPYAVHSPGDARDQGIAMIYQELSLASHLSVEENVTLGREPSRFGFARPVGAKLQEILSLLGHPHISSQARVGTLGVGEQQIVEIARALFADARVVIMDEPTSSISAVDKDRLFTAIRQLKAGGVTVIYISHFLEEVREIADVFTVLRDGRSVAAGSIADTTIGKIVQHMVGRPLNEMFPRIEHRLGDVVLEVTGLSRAPDVNDISLKLHRGEILGIAGLVGAGRTGFLRCVYGLDTATRGTVATFGGKPRSAEKMTPAASVHAGVSLLSEDRKGEGLALSLPVRDNVTLSSLRRFEKVRGTGFIDTGRERGAVRDKCRSLGIRCRDEYQRAGDLSGGNQQKVALARLIVEGGRVVLLDEPTRGIDVASKVEIYRLIGELAARGLGIVMVSSYLPELFGICDTLAVTHRGRLSAVRPVGQWNEEKVMSWATSGKESAA